MAIPSRSARVPFTVRAAARKMCSWLIGTPPALIVASISMFTRPALAQPAPALKDRTLLREFARVAPCRPGRLAIRAYPVSGASDCAVAMYALYLVGIGRARHIGVAPADTARIRTADLTSVVFPDAPGKRPTLAYWNVNLLLPGRPAVAVGIDRLTGAVDVKYATQ